MARCPPEKLSDLADLLAKVRSWDGIVEKSFACFYLKSQGFMHFHVKGDERWADARCGKDWGEALPLAIGASKAAKQAFLKKLRRYYEATAGKTPALLAGGNPRVAKGDGDAPVKAYIAAMPGWKKGVGRRLDALIAAAVPGVVKAVKWNTPFYGTAGNDWFLGFHCLTRYVKVSFLRGASLKPQPPGASKQKEVRYLDLYEGDELDEAQFAKWCKQASKLPGAKL